jgi:CHASE3 domain sensor protein
MDLNRWGRTDRKLEEGEEAMTSQMTIGKKLFVSFGASVALTLILGGTSLWLISNMGASLNKIANVTARKQFLASEVDMSESDLLSAERGILLRTLTKEPALVAQCNEDFKNTSSLLKAKFDELAPMIETEEGRRVLASAQSANQTAQQLHQEFYSMAAAGKESEAAAFLKDKVIPNLDVLSQQAVTEKRLATEQMAEGLRKRLPSGPLAAGLRCP